MSKKYKNHKDGINYKPTQLNEHQERIDLRDVQMFNGQIIRVGEKEYSQTPKERNGFMYFLQQNF